MPDFFSINNFIPVIEGGNVFDIIQNLSLQNFLLFPIIGFFVLWFLIRLFVGFSRTWAIRGKRKYKKFYFSTGIWWLEFLLGFFVLGGFILFTLFFPFYVKLLNGG